MDPDLQIKNNSRCKELLLKKLSYAVTCSVLIQLVLLTVFIFTVNFDVFSPTNWMLHSIGTLTSFTTWLFLVPFLSVIFAQSLICAKDYILTKTYSSTRIGYFFSMFSMRNHILLSLHLVSGGFFISLFLALSGPKRRLLVKCGEGDNYCLNEECIFLVLFGVCIGFYYFMWIYTTDKTIYFPVIQQKKLLRFQCNFLSILRSCQKDAILPVIFYVSIYYFYGRTAQNVVGHFFKNELRSLSTNKFFTLCFAWFYATLYIFNMKLMRFFFEMFLTEPHEFVISPINNGDLTLKDAMSINYIPIIQHLACLDLFSLSTNSKSRRELIFSLSQPGNHPHNWNMLVESVLKNLNEYTQSMNNSIATILCGDQEINPECVPVPSTNQFLKNYNYGNMRNMTLQNFDIPAEYVTVSNQIADANTITIQMKFKNKINSLISTFKRRTGINYLFEILPASNIQFLLSNGQVIIWSVQGLSSLTVASLKEDKFGVMQKDLPVILSALVELRQSIEKLNRIPALTRKTHKFDDYSNRMKININAAVKRSLYQICNEFGPYLKDLPLNNDVLQVLHVYTYQ